VAIEMNDNASNWLDNIYYRSGGYELSVLEGRTYMTKLIQAIFGYYPLSLFLKV
jgi:hypothetical protein